MSFTPKTYHITPVAKPRMTRSDKWKKRKSVQKYWAFKDEIRAAGVTIPQPCKIVFYLAMPAYWSASKRNLMIAQPHQQKPDVDNLCKALFDAVHDEDSGLWSAWIEKRWGLSSFITIQQLAVML